MSSIEENLVSIRARIREAAGRAGRDPDSVVLMAACKEVPPELVREVLAQGVKIVGENRVQEALQKYAVIGNEAEWHMIGHLQTNKVKKAFSIFSMIQSLDSLRLAEEISRQAEKLGREMDVLVEVNTSGEDTKYGLRPEEVVDFVQKVVRLDGIRVKGLFTIGIFSPRSEDSRPCFRALRELQDRLESLNLPRASLEYLSMGMTDDFEVAIEEGSNMVRIGRGVFGPRPGQQS